MTKNALEMRNQRSENLFGLGQGLSHSIQLLEVLTYENQFHIRWTGFFYESV